MITVLYISNAGGPTNGAGQSLIDLIESVKEDVKPVVFVSGKGDVYDYFIGHGIECYVCPSSTVFGQPRGWRHYLSHPWHLRLFRDYRLTRRMIKKVNTGLSVSHIDLIHTNTSTICSGYFLSRLLKIKHIWHIREYLDVGVHIQGELSYRLPRLKQMMNDADARVLVSNPCCQHWGLKKDNTWMVWDAVRSVNDCCYEKVKQPYILFCSQWVTEGKGISKTITAYGMSNLFNSSNRIRLKIVGICDKEYEKELRAIADGYGCAEYIDFIPAQKDVKPYFSQAMAFINSSVNEGMGRTTAEAMFYGCPVIAYASGGTMDLIKDGKTGYLFNTVEECAELMRKVCTTDQEDIILRAQEFAKQNLSIENYGSKIMEVYNSVLETK